MNIIQSDTQSLQERNGVRNILVRYCAVKELRTEEDYLHPENAHLVKYFPKYYQSLAIQMKRQHSLMSKIKRIKRLKRFAGGFNDHTPHVNWFKIMGNNRKEIEEFPQTELLDPCHFPWAKASFHAVKFFSWITKLKLIKRNYWGFSSEQFLEIWKAFSKHLRNMRRLKILKIKDEQNPNFLKLLLNKLNRMQRLLGKLEVLKCSTIFQASRDILQNNNVFSYLTKVHCLQFPSEVFPICQVTSQVCKHLKSLSLWLGRGLLLHSQYQDFIVPIQELPKLQSICITWPEDFSHDLWLYFIPPASLQNLKLRFLNVDLTAFKNSAKQKNFFDHWKEITKLDTLDVHFDYKNTEEVLFAKSFMTAMLKRVLILISLTCRIYLRRQGIWRYEPFNIEDVPHLYKHLKKFKVIYYHDDDSSLALFDLSFLKPFKNLKNIEFEGSPLPWTNIGEAVCLLEENMKNGEFLTLRLGEATIYYAEELNDLLKKISEAKKDGTNLKIALALEFRMEDGKYDEIKYLDEFCEIIESRAVKGLEISFQLDNFDCPGHHFDEVKRVLEKYPGIRNFVLKIFYEGDIVEYIKRDGEKEQLLLYSN